VLSTARNGGYVTTEREDAGLGQCSGMTPERPAVSA
jgi:hypothetical protein